MRRRLGTLKRFLVFLNRTSRNAMVTRCVAGFLEFLPNVMVVCFAWQGNADIGLGFPVIHAKNFSPADCIGARLRPRHLSSVCF